MRKYDSVIGYRSILKKKPNPLRDGLKCITMSLNFKNYIWSSYKMNMYFPSMENNYNEPHKDIFPIEQLLVLPIASFGQSIKFRTLQDEWIFKHA